MFRKLLFIGLFLPFYLNAQTAGQVAISIGEPGNDAGNCIINTSTGGYAIAGYTSCGACPSDLYIVRLDSIGTLEWTKAVGGSNDDYGQSLVQTKDGGFAVTGSTTSYGAGGGGIYLVKVNASGNLLWSETIGGQKGYSIIQTTDGGFAIAGYTKSCGICATKAYVIRLNSAGALKWAETVGGTSADTAFSIIQTMDGGFAVAGVTSSFGAGSTDMYLIKLDSLGNLKWSATIGGPKEETAYSVIQTKDNGYALAGYTGSFNSGPDNMYMVKLDSTGALKWTRTLGNAYNSVAMTITQSKDDGYVLAGYIYSATSGSNDLYVVKLDSVGDLTWSNEVLGGAAYASSIVQNKNGGYAATGVTTFFGAGGNDAYFLLLDSAGTSCIPTDTAGRVTAINKGTSGTGGTVNILTPVISIDTSSSDTGGLYTNYCSKITPTAVAPTRLVAQNKIVVFPNLTTGTITLQYESVNNETLCIRIIDMAGNILYSSIDNRAKAGLNNYNINTVSLAQGIYIVQIQSPQKTLYEKFVKL